MKVIVHHSHLITTSNYDKSCGLSTSKKEKKSWSKKNHYVMVGATYVSCVKQIPLPKEWDGRDPASFCLIHVNEVNIQGKKTLK